MLGFIWKLQTHSWYLRWNEAVNVCETEPLFTPALKMTDISHVFTPSIIRARRHTHASYEVTRNDNLQTHHPVIYWAFKMKGFSRVSGDTFHKISTTYHRFNYSDKDPKTEQ